MPRPKRPALKRRLTELDRPQAQAEADQPTCSGTPCSAGSPSGCSRPALAPGRSIYSRHGRPRWLHLGDAGAIGLADARTLAAEAMLAVARGKDPAAEKRAERGAGTFAELATRYVERYAKKRNKMLAAGRRARAALPAAALGQAAGRRASPAPTSAGRDGPHRGARCSPTRSWRRPRAIFSWATKQEIIARQPLPLVERNATGSRERVLSDSEVPQVLGRVRRRRARHQLRPQDDPAHRPAAGRVRPHAARAHQGRLVGAAGRAGARARLARHQERREPPRVAAPGRRGPARRAGRRAPPASCSPGRAAARSDGLDGAMRGGLQAARRRAGDAARSAPHARQHRSPRSALAATHEPHPEPQGGRHRQRLRPARIRRGEQARHGDGGGQIMALVEGRTDDKVVPLRR